MSSPAKSDLFILQINSPKRKQNNMYRYKERTTYCSQCDTLASFLSTVLRDFYWKGNKKPFFKKTDTMEFRLHLIQNNSNFRQYLNVDLSGLCIAQGLQPKTIMQITYKKRRRKLIQVSVEGYKIHKILPCMIIFLKRKHSNHQGIKVNNPQNSCTFTLMDNNWLINIALANCNHCFIQRKNNGVF